MAQKFILLSVIWLVVAIFATSTRATSPPTPTTIGPATTTTTTGPPTPTTTGPATTTTTTGPPTPTTTGPATTTTTGPPTPTTTGPATTATTGPPTPTTTGPATTTTPTTPFKDPCNPNPCGTGSTCEVRFNDTFECLCLAGDSYSNGSCKRSKVFPGKLQLKKIFNEKMTDLQSKEFKETADAIITALKIVYKDYPTYSGSVVLKLLSSDNAVSRASPEVIAVLQIIFKASSQIKEDDIIKELENNACNDCVLSGAKFETKDLCDDKSCDKESTNCEAGNGNLKCACKEGYMETDYTDRMCTACPLGEKLKNNKCVKCSFGYSGFNCTENWKLILVIVGSVLGGLLLIALILLPVVATQKSNKISKKYKSAEMEKPYTNLSSAAQPMASNKFGHSQGVSFNRSANGHSGFQNGGVSMFPRAGNPTNSWDNRTNLEMKPSNDRQNFGHMNSGSRIYDEPEDIRPYAQTRPQNNPYAQNQPRMNPYIQNQGHSNPHYTHDDGRQY